MDLINKLINLFSDFPTIGPRTAGRFVYYLMRQPEEKVSEIAKAILDLKRNIKFCLFCQNSFEGENFLCPICNNSGRDKNYLCIVEKEQDLLSIEKVGKYKGLYYILDSRDSDYKGLRQRILEPEKFGIKSNFYEIIIATNPTPEGINASVLIERVIKELNQNNKIKITRLARGIPVGGELEYADQETIESALDGRK